MMENLGDDENEGPVNQPKTMKPKKLDKIQNNRYMNQTLYSLFIQGQHEECLALIQRCKPDEYKLYIQALIFKNQFKLEKSLDLLTDCQVLNKMNFSYLKGIAKNL